MYEPVSESTATPRLPSELRQPWSTFAADPQDGTAGGLAEALKTLQAEDIDLATEAMGAIAADLARRPIRDRCLMTSLLTFWLIDATGFLKATAGAKCASSTAKPPEPGGAVEHSDPARAKSRVATKPLTAKPEPGQDHWDVLEARDVEIAELERRIDDAASAGYLEETLNLLKSIVIDGAGYSEARRRQLTTTDGTTQEHMAHQMGFRATPIRDPKSTNALSALEAQNAMAAPYWRTDFRKCLHSFLQKLPDSMLLSPGQFLVNSPNVLRKLTIVLPPEALTGITVKPLRGESGISLLSMKHDVDPAGGEVFLSDEMLNEMGASPSAYQLYELMDVGKNPPRAEIRIDTHAALAELITSSPFSRLQEIANGESGLAPVCAMVEQLILGLTDGQGPDRHDTLTATAIASLTKLIDLVVVSMDTPAVALRTVDLMMDEIGVIVSVAKNYARSDYAKAMRAILIERAPSIEKRVDVDIDVSSHLVSSGMDALATALFAALSTRSHQRVTRRTELVDYYETAQLLGKLKKGETLTPREDVLIAALNPSTPWIAPDPARLVRDVLEGLETRTADDAPFALILDATIQIPPRGDQRSQLDIVLGGLSEAIGTGELEVFVCRSLQKYATLGFGKVAAGDLTLLSGKNDLASVPALCELLEEESTLGLHRHDEAQLVVHLLKHAHRHELALIAAAAANARFVDRFCWPVGGDEALGSPYVDGVPLLLRSTTGKLGEVVEKLPTLEARDSFSFLRTSYTDGIDLPRGPGGATVNYVRFNTGHESEAAMAEIFYGLGHLATGLLPGAESAKPEFQADLHDLNIETVMRHLEALAGADQLPDKARENPEAAVKLLRRYRNNIIASYCLCALLVRGPAEHKIGMLVDFFNKNTDDVTTDTLRALAEFLLRQVATLEGNVGGDSPRLTAVCRAAAILPPWQFPAEALKIDLSGLDESESAIRLRKLVDRANKVNEKKSRKKMKTKTN